MRQATLAGVPGIVDLRFAMRPGLDGEWRGTFFLGADREADLDGMIGDPAAVLETTLEEERRILPVTILTANAGHVSFRSDARSVPTDRPSVTSTLARGHGLCPSADHDGQASSPSRSSRSSRSSRASGARRRVHDRGRHVGRSA